MFFSAAIKDSFSYKSFTFFLKEILSEDSLYINAMRLLVMHYNSKSIKQVEMIKMVHQILDLLPNDEFASEILKSSKKTKKSVKKPVY